MLETVGILKVNLIYLFIEPFPEYNKSLVGWNGHTEDGGTIGTTEGLNFNPKCAGAQCARAFFRMLFLHEKKGLEVENVFRRKKSDNWQPLTPPRKKNFEAFP